MGWRKIPCVSPFLWGVQMRDFYDDQHWNELLETIVERIGTEKFLLLTAKQLRKKEPDLAHVMEMTVRGDYRWLSYPAAVEKDASHAIR